MEKSTLFTPSNPTTGKNILSPGVRITASQAGMPQIAHKKEIKEKQV